MRYVSLSDNDIYSISNEALYNNAKIKAAQAKKILLIKSICFYCVGVILVIFFGYYLSTFSAVYRNTQIILIKNVLISYALSLIFPFIIIAFSSILRRYALKDSTRQWIYNIGRLLQYL